VKSRPINGTAIDATTFAFSINRSLDPCFASGVSYYNLNIKGATDYNSKTCDAGADGLDKTAATAAYFLSEMSYPTFWGVPQQLIAKYGQTKWTDHLADGSGLGGNIYKLTTWDHFGQLTFERNERFWGAKPLLRRIEYTLYKDIAVQWNDFAQGKGDSTLVPSAALAAARALHGVVVYSSPALSVTYLTPNWAVAPFDDVRIRQAFSLALDRTALGPASLQAVEFPTIHLVPEGIPGYNPDLTDVAGRRGKDALTPDLPAARKLASAYAAEKCAGDFAKCPPVTYTILGNSSTQMDLAQAVVAQWQRAFPGWRIQAAGWRANGELKTFPVFQLLRDGWAQTTPIHRISLACFGRPMLPTIGAR
jgi:peptide/nickel transport system substrate-binding protein/oligopeptide transport system substrate-binding protein